MALPYVYLEGWTAALTSFSATQKYARPGAINAITSAANDAARVYAPANSTWTLSFAASAPAPVANTLTVNILKFADINTSANSAVAGSSITFNNASSSSTVYTAGPASVGASACYITVGFIIVGPAWTPNGGWYLLERVT